MIDKLKMEKFHKNDSGTIHIRDEVLSNGKVIAFSIALTDLIMLQQSEKIDFDKLSDGVLEKFSDSRNNHAFQYEPNNGFVGVEVNQQNWFTF